VVISQELYQFSLAGKACPTQRAATVFKSKVKSTIKRKSRGISNYGDFPKRLLIA
jgi:hypothetical protein